MENNKSLIEVTKLAYGQPKTIVINLPDGQTLEVTAVVGSNGFARLEAELTDKDGKDVAYLDEKGLYGYHGVGRL